MTPFPLTPTVDTAPAPKPDRRPVPVREEEKFSVPAIEQDSPSPIEPVAKVDTSQAKRNQGKSTEHDRAENTVTASHSDQLPAQSTPNHSSAALDTPELSPAGELNTTAVNLFQSLTASSQRTAGATATINAVTAQAIQSGSQPPAATVQAATASPAVGMAAAQPDTLRATQSQNTSTGGPLPTTGTGSVAAETAAPATGAIATASVATAVPQTARGVATMPAKTADAAASLADVDGGPEAPVRKVAAIAAGNSESGISVPVSTVTKSNPATAGASALSTNPQLLAQAMANTGSDATIQSLDVQSAKQTMTPQAVPDTPTVSQNFNTEMRAAIDAPTQAAAYTAKGAVTAQPAAEQIALQISRAANQGADRLTVHLKPAELGKITIDLEVGPDNRLIAVIAADKSETLDLLQRDARQLERALQDAGLKTDSGSLEFNLSGDGNAAEDGTDGDDKLMDGAVMLPGTSDDPYGQTPHGHNPLILPEGRIDIQV